MSYKPNKERPVEGVRVIFDDAKYDAAVHGGAPSAPDIQVIIKDQATEEGRPGVVITFSSQDDKGELVKQQNVMTARMWVSVAQAIIGRYPSLME